MVDFLAENNLCGQTVLRLVSRGNAIIAELLRLSDFIPPVFRDWTSRPEHAKYAELLSDFSYFSSADYFENNIISKSVSMCRLTVSWQWFFCCFYFFIYNCTYLV